MMTIVINTVLDLSSLGPSHSEVWVLLMAEGHNVLEWMKWEVLLFNEKKKWKDPSKKERHVHLAVKEYIPLKEAALCQVFGFCLLLFKR